MARKQPLSATLAVWLALIVSAPARGASFDCSVASTPVERLICSDPELSQLDSKLGDTYRARAAQSATVKQVQRAWIVARDKQCEISAGPMADRPQIKACMKAAILARTAELSGGSAESFSLPSPSRIGGTIGNRADIATKSDLEDDNIAWVSEHPTDSCSEITYDFPASLVPIQDDAAATGGLEWHSFDQKTTFYYETKATYFSVTGMPHAYFLNTVRCDAKLNSVLAEALGEKNAGNKGSKLISCEEGLNKVRFVTTDKGNICSTVFAIAPDQRNESRFVADLQLCAPASVEQSIGRVSHRMFTSLSMRYLGCCKKDRNVIGCYSPN